VCCACAVFFIRAHSAWFLVVQRFLLSAAGDRDRIRDDRKDPENADEVPEEREEEEKVIELEDAQMQTDDLPRVETHEKQGDTQPRCEPWPPRMYFSCKPHESAFFY
jgi:hypothetical protein